MREACGKLSQGSQAVALLLHTGDFTNSVGHQTDKMLRQLRHLLNKIGKQGCGETQYARIRDRSPTHGKLFHPGERQRAGYVPRLHRKYGCVAAKVAANLESSLEHDEHGVRGI